MLSIAAPHKKTLSQTSFFVGIFLAYALYGDDIHLVVDDIAKIVRNCVDFPILTKMLILSYLLRGTLPAQKRVTINASLSVCPLLQRFGCWLAHPWRDRRDLIDWHHLDQLCIGPNNPHIWE
jgi:hypothetical protein